MTPSSSETSQDTPSTPKQRLLGAETGPGAPGPGPGGGPPGGENGAVYAWLPASPGKEGVPVLALLAHLDTAPRVPSEHVQARVVRYQGRGTWCSTRSRASPCPPADFPDLGRSGGAGAGGHRRHHPPGGRRQGRGWRRFSPPWRPSSPTRSSPTAGWRCASLPTRRWAGGPAMWTWTSWGPPSATPWTAAPWGSWNTRTSTPPRRRSSSTGVNIHPGGGEEQTPQRQPHGRPVHRHGSPGGGPRPTTEGYEGFYHLCTMEGGREPGPAQWLIRDHDWDSFQRRKRTLEGIALLPGDPYGLGTVEVKLTDSYYNMREKVLPHPQLLDWAREALPPGRGGTRDVPIRGGTDGGPAELAGPALPQPLHRGYHFHGVYEYIPVQSLETMAQVLVAAPGHRGGPGGKFLKKSKKFLLTNGGEFDILNIARYGGRTRRHSSVG